jgi:glyoxylase-like metal-dependent hydrolase (beta-lactamase superfamily II)
MARVAVWLTAAALTASSLPAHAQPSVMQMRSETLTPAVHVILGFANGNILVLVAGDSVMLVDGQSARRVELADSVLRTLTNKPVALVINTHYHGDHTEGNAHWHAHGARSLAHAAVPVQAAKDTVVTSFENWHRTPLARAAMPTETMTDSLAFAFGGEPVIVRHLPGAHTDGDLVVWLPRANIVHAGDLVELGAYPFIDWWAGGSLDGMIRAVDTLVARMDERTRLVPGHGPVATIETVRAYREMLVDVRARVMRALSTGETIEQLVASAPTAAYDGAHGGARGGERFVRLVYMGLARQPDGGGPTPR